MSVRFGHGAALRRIDRTDTRGASARFKVPGWRLVATLSTVFLLGGCVQRTAMNEPAAAIIQDSFTGGTPELVWRPYPYFNQDNLKGAVDPTSPEGEPGVGVLDNRNAGGFAALAYAETRSLADFYLEAWLHVQATKEARGALNGIAFRVDPAGDRFYRFAAQFAAEPSLSLAYVGKDTKHFPVIVAEWKGASIPGGAPKQSGWHRVAIEVKDNAAEIFWNGTRLPGGPFAVDRAGPGYIGVYATFSGGLGIAETRIDGLKVRLPA